MIPVSPRLHPRCHLIPDPPGVVLRHGGVYLRVRDPKRAERIHTLAQLLDGRTAEAVLSGFGLKNLREGMQILEELQGAGFLVEDGERLALPCAPQIAQLRGSSVAVTGTGLAADSLRNELTRSGAVLTNDSAQLHIVCPQGAQLAMLEEWDAQSRVSGEAWMPAIRLGDDLCAGPIIKPGQPGCFHCFVLRWLGMASSIPSEVAYFEWLRGDGWREETMSHEENQLLCRHAIEAASAAIKGTASAGTVSFLNLESGEKSNAHLLPHPLCKRCGSVQTKPKPYEVWQGWRSAVPGTAIENLAAGLEAVVDDRIGLVGRLVQVDNPPSAPGGISLVAKAGQFALPLVHGIRGDHSNVCAGLQRTAELAGLVAIVEGMERYCGLFPMEPDVVARYDQVAHQALLPTRLPLFSDTQYAQAEFPFRRFDPTEPLSWVWGYSLTDDVPRLVPKSAATYGRTDDKLVSECSSGVAARTSLAEATLRGLFEMIERDAFMIFWLNRLSPPLIDFDTLPKGFAKAAVEELRAAGYQLVAANITTDLGIPVFLAFALRQDGKYPALVAGAGCSFDPAEALDKAFHETLGAVRWHLSDPNSQPKNEPMEPEQVCSLTDHHAAYSHPAWLMRAEFLWSSPVRQQLHQVNNPAASSISPGEQLGFAVDLLRTHGLELIAVNLTTPDVAQTGVCVVRAIVPGLQPIGFGQHAARLGGERVFLAPCRMGYRIAPITEDALNPDPHCFP